MSSYTDAATPAIEHCEAMAQQHADLSGTYEAIANFLTQKLWHQLTVACLALFRDEANVRATATNGANSFLVLLTLLETCQVDKKLNSLSLAQMAHLVSQSLLATDPTASKAVLEGLLEKKARLGIPATVYLDSQLGLLQLWIMEHSKDPLPEKELMAIQERLEANHKIIHEMILDNASQESSIVHSSHYLCGMKYRKAVGPPEAFYEQAISYLNYTPLEQVEQPVQLAVDLSLAALTGEGVFHLGELVTTPITDKAWLMLLLHSMAKGDVHEFERLSGLYATQIQAEPALMSRKETVQEKMTLLALVTLIFERPSSDRCLTFADIAQRTKTPHVERMVMRALSLSLIQGSLDEIDQTVQVTWVMPRVLTKEQMANLASHFGTWAIKVSQTKDTMTKQTPALFT
jgi:26S proteasome regulatory subunit N9